MPRSGRAPDYSLNLEGDRRRRRWRTPGRLGTVLRSGAATAAVIGVAAVIVLAIVVARPIATGPATTPPAATAGDPIRAGDGIADPTFIPFLQAVAWLAAVVGLAVLALRARRRVITIAATLAVVGLVWVAANIGTSDALEEGGSWRLNPSSSEQPDKPGEFLGVDGDQPFEVIFTVTNRSSVPLELRGLVPTTHSGVYDPPIVPRFVGLGVFPTLDIVVDQVVPFRPITLAPGERANLYVLGMAGTCARAKEAPGVSGGFTSLEGVDLVYEQLTIVHTQHVVLGERVNVRWPDQCP